MGICWAREEQHWGQHSITVSQVHPLGWRVSLAGLLHSSTEPAELHGLGTELGRSRLNSDAMCEEAGVLTCDQWEE